MSGTNIRPGSADRDEDVAATPLELLDIRRQFALWCAEAGGWLQTRLRGRIQRIPEGRSYMTPRPHVLDDCWCGQSHHDEIRGDGDDLRVRPSDSRAGSQAGSNGPSGSLNPSPRRAPGRMEQDEFNSRSDSGEDPYSIVADDRARSAATTESREQREERWINWTQRAWSHCPLSLYDEHQKLGEIAVGEMLAEIKRLTTRGGIARSLMTVRQAERFHDRCKELGV